MVRKIHQLLQAALAGMVMLEIEVSPECPKTCYPRLSADLSASRGRTCVDLVIYQRYRVPGTLRRVREELLDHRLSFTG
jgi:hypothetical protein